MADEFFRDMDDFASSDIIYSMREQMTPSDEVVASLLAKIARCDASPEGSNNTDNAAVFTPVENPKVKRFGRRSLVSFASVAAACVIMLTSAFAIIGTGSPSGVNKLIDKITPNNVVTAPAEDSDETGSKGSEETKDAKDATNTGDDVKDSDVSESPAEEADSDDVAQEANAQNKTDVTSASQNQNQNATVPSNGENTNTPAPAPDNSAANTVDKTGNGDATFSREILAEESVSHLTISGSNYVVDTSAASPVTTSEIKSISLEIPETSTTNNTVVKAHVKKIKNVSANLMVALDVNGFKDTLLYTNESYSPNTLGEFISDAGLDEEVSFSKYVYCKGENIGYSSYHKFSVPDISEYAENYLFMNESAPLSSHILYEVADTHVTFKSKSNPTCSSIDFGVSDNGYLYVKMAGGKSFTFYVGTDSTSSFISSITEE